MPAHTADARARRRQQRRRQVQRRRFVALLVLAAIIIALVFIVRALLSGSPDFSGTWQTDSTALGASAWRITDSGGQTYAVTGAGVLSRTHKVVYKDGRLIVTGTSKSASWRIELSLLDDGHQLLARYTAATGKPAVEVRFTRTAGP